MTKALAIRYSIFAMAGMAIDDERYATMMMLFITSSLNKIPHFDGKYDPDAYISWELFVEQKFACFEFPESARVRVATSEFSDFAYVWWVEYGKKHPNDIPQTWIALKRVCGLDLFLHTMHVISLISFNN
jgi:hypothetical protein